MCNFLADFIKQGKKEENLSPIMSIMVRMEWYDGSEEQLPATHSPHSHHICSSLYFALPGILLFFVFGSVMYFALLGILLYLVLCSSFYYAFSQNANFLFSLHHWNFPIVHWCTLGCMTVCEGLGKDSRAYFSVL